MPKPTIDLIFRALARFPEACCLRKEKRTTLSCQITEGNLKISKRSTPMVAFADLTTSDLPSMFVQVFSLKYIMKHLALF